MKINRFSEIPQKGLFCDLLWADPIDHPEGKLNGLV
jgi:serine/threonine-protein phosphatase 2B catalytic subunit